MIVKAWQHEWCWVRCLHYVGVAGHTSAFTASFLHLMFAVDEEYDDDNLLYERNMFWKFLGGKIEVPEVVELRVPVAFTYPDTSAVAVNLIGSWDDEKGSTPMVNREDGFSALVQLAPGNYV